MKRLKPWGWTLASLGSAALSAINTHWYAALLWLIIAMGDFNKLASKQLIEALREQVAILKRENALYRWERKL